MRLCAALLLLAAGLQNAAADGLLVLEGLADLRLARSSDQRSWVSGGLGKTGVGHGDQDLQLPASLILDGRLSLAPDLTGFVSTRFDPGRSEELHLLETYLRYRPVSTSPLRWSIRAGAFWPPVSLENDGPGWTSTRTLTPSALNTWVGEELRTIGAEVKLEWRGAPGSSIELVGALHGWNDGSGTLLADRGWALGDRPTGLFNSTRLPDELSRRFRRPGPFENKPFLEIDHRVGWYLGLAWQDPSVGRIAALTYDNRGNPSAFEAGEYGWRTRFTSLSYETHFDRLVLIAQAMVGDTIIDPTPGRYARTDYQTAFVLLEWDLDQWRIAGRIEAFATQTPQQLDERGRAFTLAVSWLPQNWLQLTAEALRIESSRTQRTFVGLPDDATEDLLQLNLRVYF